jgi:hypothetical protein
MKRDSICLMTLVAVLSVWAMLASAADQKTFVMGYDPGAT